MLRDGLVKAAQKLKSALQTVGVWFGGLFIALILLSSCGWLSLAIIPTGTDVDTRSGLEADYGPWEALEFQPLDPAIIGDIEIERGEVPEIIGDIGPGWNEPQLASESERDERPDREGEGDVSVPGIPKPTLVSKITSTATIVPAPGDTATPTQTTTPTLLLSQTPTVTPISTTTSTMTATSVALPTSTLTAAPTSTNTSVPAPPPRLRSQQPQQIHLLPHHRTQQRQPSRQPVPLGSG